MKKLSENGIALGTMLFSSRSHATIAICEAAGAEFVILDQEATGLSFETLESLIAIGRALHITTIVRVPAARHDYISRALDIGATGIMVPTVSSAEQAHDIVSMSKYPPVGVRGVMAGLAASSYRAEPSVADALVRANRETIVIVQIETADGVRHAHAIAAVDGVNIVWVGGLDLSVSLGVPGEFRAERFVSAVRHVSEAAHAAGKLAGAKVSSIEDGLWWLDRGYRCIAYSDDVRILREGLVEGIEALRVHARREQVQR